MPISGTTPILGAVAPNDALDTYPSHLEEYGKGGFRTVADNTERDAISAERRKAGMIVQVLSPRKFFQLDSGLSNSDWFEVFLMSHPGTVDTTALLKEIPTARCGGFILRLGDAAVGDGGHGLDYWDATCTDVDSPPLVSRPNDFSSQGAWRNLI